MPQSKEWAGRPFLSAQSAAPPGKSLFSDSESPSVDASWSSPPAAKDQGRRARHGCPRATLRRNLSYNQTTSRGVSPAPLSPPTRAGLALPASAPLSALRRGGHDGL